MPIKQGSATSKSRRVFGLPDKRTRTELRAAHYARVSTHDQQTLPMQNRAMREYAARRGWAIALPATTQPCRKDTELGAARL
jgi:hypothetical protein